MQDPTSPTGTATVPRARRIRAVAALSAALLVTGAGGVALAGPTDPTDPPTTETTTTTTTTSPPTSPPPTTPPPTAPPTAPPTTSRPRPTTTSPPRSTTTRPPETTEAPTTTTTTRPSTTTTAAPAVVGPGDSTTIPGDDGDGGGSGPSSGRKLALVVGGLLAVAGGISVLTVLYWRRTRPAPYNSALDAVGELAGPPPVTEATPAVVGEPHVVSAGAAATPRSPADAAVLSAALAAAGEATRPAPPAEPGAGEDATHADGVDEAPRSPAGGAGFRIMGPVGAAAAAADGVGSTGDDAAASPAPEPDADRSTFPVVAEPSRFVTREELEADDSGSGALDPITELFALYDPNASAPAEEPLQLWDDAPAGPPEDQPDGDR